MMQAWEEGGREACMGKVEGGKGEVGVRKGEIRGKNGELGVRMGRQE